jgi:hypothetical protein
MGQFFSVGYKFFRNGSLLSDGRFHTTEENFLSSKEMNDLSKQFTNDAESDHVEIIIVNARKISKEQFDSETLLKELMKE